MTTRHRGYRAATVAVLALTLTASACGSDSGSAGRGGNAAATSAPRPGGTIPGASDPGPGPTTLDGVAVRLQVVATADSPVDLVPRAGTDDLYVAEQGGMVRVVRVGPAGGGTPGVASPRSYHVDPNPVLDLSTLTQGNGERGLLGIAFSADGQLLYVDYTDQNGDSHVVEYPMTGDRADFSRPRELLFQPQPFPNHNGGGIVFGPDGYLYIGFGDGGSGGDPNGNGQNTQTWLGKILRIDPAARTGDKPYGIPDGNPFADAAGNANGGLPEIWLYGVRNPWRFSFDRDSGDLWIGEVGQNTYEEVDLLPATDGRDAGRGANLGWNAMEGTHPFNGGVAPAGAIPPIFDYSHDGGNCSVIGGFVYRGAAIPALQGTYLFGDYCVGEVRGLLQRNGTALDERSLGATVGQGLTSFGQDAQGELYAMDSSGQILRIEPI